MQRNSATRNPQSAIPLPISVCMIASNEAHRIGNALKSVAGWVSEIVIVLNDNVSDGTDKIAESFGAKVFREPWKGFIAQKNSATEKCSQPWLLNLDADETVTSELRDEIARRLERDNNVYSAYSFPRCTFYLGRWIRHGDWYPDRCTRLWQRGRALWAGEDPHAHLVVHGPITKLKSDMRHYSAESINYQITKTVNYADVFAKHASTSGKAITFSDLLFRPAWRFWRGYLFRLGFLDGWQGFTVAWMTAFYTFLRYARARESQLSNVTRNE